MAEPMRSINLSILKWTIFGRFFGWSFRVWCLNGKFQRLANGFILQFLNDFF